MRLRPRNNIIIFTIHNGTLSHMFEIDKLKLIHFQKEETLNFIKS